MFKSKKLVTALAILFVMASNAYSMTYEEAYALAKEGKSSKAISYLKIGRLSRRTNNVRKRGKK